MKNSFGHIIFRSTREAVRESGLCCDDSNPYNILLWFDSLKDKDYFRQLKPWQVVNRIPNVNVLCRKVSFTHMLMRIAKYFPNEYSFVPKSYILPNMNSEFMRSVSKRKHRYIVKPDGGSLGLGIRIIEPGENYAPNYDLQVAQKYIPSFLWNQKKFDLRIYVLLASVTPLEIYVYRDGLARFCFEKDEGKNTIYSQITNVGLNKNVCDLDHISDISKILSDVLEEFEQNKVITAEELWKKIDNVIVLTILSSYKFLLSGVNKQCPNFGYPRCFQILGFDILLDEQLEPHVLEVNYRPSLEYYRGKERRMKVGMISDAIKIAVPLHFAQSCVLSRKSGWCSEDWAAFATDPCNKVADIFTSNRKNAVKQTKFECVYPAKTQEMQVLYDKIISKVESLPLEPIPGMLN